MGMRECLQLKKDHMVAAALVRSVVLYMDRKLV